MKLDILNVKKNPLNDEDIKAIVEIELHPKVKKWLVEYDFGSSEKEFLEYKRFFNEVSRNKMVEVLVARCEGKIVGFLALWMLNEKSESTASIGVSVHPDFWGRGIATSLVKESIKLAVEKGIKKLIIETLEENNAMRRVAEKLGFKLETKGKNKMMKTEVIYSLTL